MPAIQYTSSEQSPKNNTLLLCLMAAGLAGNYFKYPIFLNIDFLFGSIFTMLVLQFFGIGRGIAATAIVASYTYLIWNHPYAIIIQIAELIIVGWLFSRRKMGLVIADMLFWLLVGMPLVYLFYHVVMHIAPVNAYLTMTKQAMNGILNVLLARLIFTAYVMRSRTALISYREIVNNLLTLFVLCPALILMMIGSKTDFSETDLRIKNLLIENIEHEHLILDNWATDRKTTIVNLAQLAATGSPQKMQPFIEQAAKNDHNFLRLGLLDKNATITAYYPLFDDEGQENIGKKFADRPFIPLLRSTLKPMLSEVVMGKIAPQKPIVAMLAPVITHGVYNGYITGILNLDIIKNHLDQSMKINNTIYTLLDKSDNIIMTNRSNQKIMSPLNRGQGQLKHLDDKISQWIPALPKNTPVSERWKESFYISSLGIGAMNEWKLVLEQPVAPFQKTIFNNYTNKFIQLFLILLVALILTEYLTHRLISTHETLQKVSRDLPCKVASGEKVDWPDSGIFEICSLISNFKVMSDSLATQFHEVQKINEYLEKRVDDRTFELNKLMHELDIILTNTPIGIAKIVNSEIVWGNRKLTEMFNYPLEELELQPADKLFTTANAYEALTREAYPIMLQGVMFETELNLITKDGFLSLIRLIGTAIEPGNMAKGAIWLLEDVTKRREEEEEKKAFDEHFQETQRLESLGILAGGIAHDFNNLLLIIMGNCTLAKMEPENYTDHLTAIENASERAAALCQQMLEYAGHTHIAKSRVNLITLVHDMVEVMTSAGHKNIVIKQTVSQNIPHIHGDASQIRQVLLNLITNATEAIGETQGEIDVIVTKTSFSLEQVEKDHLGRTISEGMYVCLEVTDNGCGMNEETRRKMFEPFFTTKFTGRGLGLSATLGIVNSHKGALQLISQPGKGTTFKVFFPAQEKGSDTEYSQMQTAQSALWQGAGTILLVDDEDKVRLVGNKIISKFGFKVIEAMNGKEALEIFNREKGNINLVITDLGMPQMDGYDLFIELKKLAPELPIIISSGFGDKEISDRIHAEEMAGLISKPYNLVQLQNVLRKIFEKSADNQV